ncbi:MAG: PDZ domain-containing protein, partial [Planctomycetes bacterium]|nr:PDZ domain-containing protein [Planctomycetota bacterium]
MPKRNLIWMVVVLALAGLVVWLARYKPIHPQPAVDVGPFGPLIRLHELAESHYVDPVSPNVPAGAIRGYLRELDPYCRYVNPGRPKYLDRLLHGQSCALGIRYVIAGGAVRIVGSMPGSPAFDAGVLGGDVLLAVDGQELAEATREEVDELLAGEEATTAGLQIDRAGRVLTIPIVRRVYRVETVTGLCRGSDGQWLFMVDGDSGIGYVRIGQFASGTAQSFDEIIRPLARQAFGGLVLDLRDNPGGRLDEAVEVADRFIDDGLIVLTRGRADGEERHMAHSERTLWKMPLVVLIDHHTASAPEVVAGALKAHRRAVLVGTRTFGKTVVQKPFSLGRHMGAVVLTTSRYFFTAAEPTSRPGPACTSEPMTKPADKEA